MLTSGKRALVTGGSRGMGAEIAKKLASEGADVALTYVNSKDAADAVVREIEGMGRKAVAIKADNRKAQDIQNAVQQAARDLGGLDILVNNAGNFIVAPIEEMSIESFDASISVNLRAAFIACKEAVPILPNGGRIIFIGSNLAFHTPFAGLSAYAPSKAGISGLAHALGRELGPREIAVSAIHPGSTNTDMNPENSEVADSQRQAMSRPKFVQPGEIADLVAFLASDKSQSITGVDWIIDNGTNA